MVEKTRVSGEKHKPGLTVIKFCYEFRTRTPKLSNQNVVWSGCDILIGCFSSTSAKLVLESFMTVRSDTSHLQNLLHEYVSSSPW